MFNGPVSCGRDIMFRVGVERRTGTVFHKITKTSINRFPGINFDFILAGTSSKLLRTAMEREDRRTGLS
jgi:hypothetical protein